MDTPTELLTSQQVADRLGLHKETVLLMARQGRIPRIELAPGSLRFDWNEVVKTLKAASEKAIRKK